MTSKRQRGWWSCLKQARRESGMHRQGRGWGVWTDDDRIQIHRLGRELSHRLAQAVLSDWRLERADWLYAGGEVTS